MPRYLKLSETKSTNSYLAGTASALPGGTVIYTYRQTAGRGQKGNSWESEDNKNLAFSYLLKSPHIEPSRQFFISEAVSLAVADMLSQYVPEGISIKWPNDIYYRDQKICGILIENTLSGSHIGHSIISLPGCLPLWISGEILRMSHTTPRIWSVWTCVTNMWRISSYGI